MQYLIYLVYLVSFLSLINIIIGVRLYINKKSDFGLRHKCYISVLVQLPMVMLLLILGEHVPVFPNLMMVILYFLGYYLSCRLLSSDMFDDKL